MRPVIGPIDMLADPMLNTDLDRQGWGYDGGIE
jgi:hypothetical protein